MEVEILEALIGGIMVNVMVHSDRKQVFIELCENHNLKYCQREESGQHAVVIDYMFYNVFAMPLGDFINLQKIAEAYGVAKLI